MIVEGVAQGGAGDERKCIAVIGIDRYSGRKQLHNAVNDARGVLDAFVHLGFECVAKPLLDEDATHDALVRLVREDLKQKLTPNDSLVLFFAGHGHSETHRIDGGPVLRKGYLLPVDASKYEHTWLELSGWLGHVAWLRARHILVILDSCYSGVALDHEAHYRGVGLPPAVTGDRLVRRASRRVLTSALDDELASDSGPMRGHSLFAGCLLDAVQGGIFSQTGKLSTTGFSLAAHVREAVREHAAERQNPAFGTLEGDNRGDLILPLSKSKRRKRGGKQVAHRLPPVVPEVVPEVRSVGFEVAFDHSEGWAMAPTFAAALDLHRGARERGFQVLSVIAGEAMATQTMWATWAARQGYLTLRTEGRSVETAIAELLAQMPWLRCLSEARKRLAAAARIAVEAVDAALDARHNGERQRWIGDVAALDRHARVSGWLLSALRERAASVPDLATAPVQGGELLAIACDLACPTAVVIHHPAPDAAWLERALGVAAVLTTHLPRRCVAVVAPDEIVTAVLRSGRSSGAMTMARQGLVTLAAPAERIPGRGRRRTARVLLDALAADPRTRGRFEIDRQVALGEGGPAIDVGLLAARTRIVIELDGWHHFHDPEGYQRDRIQDLRLQRAGYFVLRFLAEDVDERLASTIDQIALALASRRTQGGFVLRENNHV